MGVKGANLEINSGLLLSSFILDYMIIRVKEKESVQEKKNNRKRGMNEREREKRRGKQRH